MSDERLDPAQERVAAYLKSRSAVRVPDDLLPAAMRRVESKPDRPVWQRPSRLFAGLAAAVALVVVAVIVGLSLPNVPAPAATPRASELAPASTGPSLTPTPPTSPSTSPSIFPSSVADMPVITVAQAVALLDAGQVNGRAVAVAGYFAELFLPCPAPMGYVAPLEDWCRAVAFTDHDLGLGMGNPMNWSIPTDEPNLSPYLVTETAGQEAMDVATESQPLVLIGHAGDPRQWQCSPDTKSDCARDFVVDRVAWADGSPVPLISPTMEVSVRMTVADLAAATGGGGLITAAALKASDAWTIDPRFRSVGDDPIWVVRSVRGAASASSGDPTRSVAVWLIDDATDTVLYHLDLAISPSYQPARLSIQATRPPMNGSDNISPFDRISQAGTAVLEDWGWTMYGNRTETRYGPGPPAILDPGTYTVEAWLATVIWSAPGNSYVVGEAYDNCSTEVSLNALDDVVLQAAFRKNGPCTWGPAPSESPH